MAKTININPSHEYTSRAGTMSVAQALAWVEKHATTEDEDGNVETYAPGDLIVYAVRRMQALSKDNARIGRKEKPTRIYTPRVDVTGASKDADAVKARARESFARALHLVAAVKAPKARKESKAPKASTERKAPSAAQIAARERFARAAKERSAKATSAKLPPPAPVKAKGPAVRKAAQRKPVIESPVPAEALPSAYVTSSTALPF